MKTKIILLLFSIVFVSSAILLYMVTNTFKKDKISYVYEVLTAQTQSLAHQLQSEIESLDLLASVLTQKNGQTSTLNDVNLIHVFSVIEMTDTKPEIITEYIQKNKIKDATAFEMIQEKIHKLNKIDEKTFFSKNGLIYEIILNQLVPSKIAAAIGFESEVSTQIVESSKEDQFGFILDQNLNILIGDSKNLNLFSTFIEKNKSKKWSDSQSGQIKSNVSEPWIYSLSTVAGTDLKILNLVSEKKAFAVMQTIYFKSFISFILILSFVVVIGIISATYLTDKLNQLTIATKKVTQGQLEIEIAVSGKDEIASLSADFNLMVKQIKKLLSETAEQARMENELKTAQLVQENLFPEASKTYSNCIITGYCKPASECGGDWWFHAEDKNYVNIIIADATGHGVPAALMTSAIKSAFILTAKMNLSPKETITKINEALCEVGRNKVMMTAFYIRIDKKTDLAEYINASHEAPFILDLNLDSIDKSHLIFLNDNSSARLGQASDTNYKASEIQLTKKQRLFLYTDGIFDLKNDDLKKLTERDFFKKVIEFANKKTDFTVYAEDIKKFIFNYHTQKTLDDDVTLCHIEII